VIDRVLLAGRAVAHVQVDAGEVLLGFLSNLVDLVGDGLRELFDVFLFLRIVNR
jgi:hypothetical protein